MFVFDEDTALDRRGDGCWSGEIHSRWNVGTAPNGGYLMALGARALDHMLPHPHPFSVSAHFLRRPEPGPFETACEVVRAGRRHSVGQVSLIQDGVEVVRMIGNFGDHEAASGPTLVSAEPPEIGDPDELLKGSDYPLLPEVARRFDHRFTPESASWAFGEPTGRAVMEGMTRFADGREPDPLSLLVIADALPPPVFNVTQVVWVPTLEMTVHVRAIPSPGWLRFRFRPRVLVDGYLEEDGEIWDSSGKLVALSRQIALALSPSG